MANKMRSLLAMLGIIIGVGAVISMLSLGAAKIQMEKITAMGTLLVVVRLIVKVEFVRAHEKHVLKC